MSSCEWLGSSRRSQFSSLAAGEPLTEENGGSAPSGQSRWLAAGLRRGTICKFRSKATGMDGVAAAAGCYWMLRCTIEGASPFGAYAWALFPFFFPFRCFYWAGGARGYWGLAL